MYKLHGGRACAPVRACVCVCVCVRFIPLHAELTVDKMEHSVMAYWIKQCQVNKGWIIRTLLFSKIIGDRHNLVLLKCCMCFGLYGHLQALFLV
jgi:hypothetical protein